MIRGTNEEKVEDDANISSPNNTIVTGDTTVSLTNNVPNEKKRKETKSKVKERKGKVKKKDQLLRIPPTNVLQLFIA
jgi:hypothetical protein